MQTNRAKFIYHSRSMYGKKAILCYNHDHFKCGIPFMDSRHYQHHSQESLHLQNMTEYHIIVNKLAHNTVHLDISHKMLQDMINICTEQEESNSYFYLTMEEKGKEILSEVQ